MVIIVIATDRVIESSKFQTGAHTAKINAKWRFIAALQQKWKSSCANILSIAATTEGRIQERKRYKHKHNDNNVYKMHMAIRKPNVICRTIIALLVQQMWYIGFV